MTAVEFAVQWAIAIAQDESHGYDQINRQGPDYDCSSLVINAFDRAGIPVKANGATYTGNMKNAFIKSGFINVTGSVQLKTGAGLVRGDVLLRESGHAALHIGNGQIVNAQWNENGGITGGETGDQTGKEICLKGYYNSPWNVILRLPAGTVTPPEIVIPIDQPIFSGPVIGYTPERGDESPILKVMKRYYVVNGGN